MSTGIVQHQGISDGAQELSFFWASLCFGHVIPHLEAYQVSKPRKFELSVCALHLHSLLVVVFALALFESHREEHIPVRRDLHDLHVGQDVVARAEASANLGVPVGHVPLEAVRRDVGGPPEGDDADVLAKDVLLAVLADLDVMRAGLEQEGEAGAREEVDPAGGVAGVRLEEVEVVKLREALVNAAADAPESDDIDPAGVLLSDPVDGLGEVGRLLVGVVDDGCRRWLGGVEIADCRGERVKVADDELEVGLGGVNTTFRVHKSHPSHDIRTYFP